MASSYGKNIITTIYGSSHGPHVGVKIEGLPKGTQIDFDELQQFLNRRAPGQNGITSPRKEPDTLEVITDIKYSDVSEAIIENKDVDRNTYENLKMVPRPGHADFAAYMKFGNSKDMSGGGEFSGRMTAPLCIAGGIFKQLLEARGITVEAHIKSIGAEEIHSDLDVDKVTEIIKDIKEEKDSIGGVVECVVTGMPAGVGGELFEGLEGDISRAVFGIPAVKGIEFGSGFEGSKMRGSQNNDPFYKDGDVVKTMTNNHGGILGGISSGMPIVFRVAFKPTPSIGLPQQSVNLETGEVEIIKVEGRHDPCIVPRGLPCVEAAAAMVIYDRLVGEGK